MPGLFSPEGFNTAFSGYQQHLVDELRLVVAPTVAAGGRRLFADDGELQRFKLLEARGTPAGLALLAYAKRA